MQVYPASTNFIDVNSSPSLVYQVGLLRQRNKLLTLENKNLLEKIEQLSDSLSKVQEKMEINEKKYLFFKEESSKQKVELIRLTDHLHNQIPSNSKLIIQQMLKNQCSISSILQTLRQSLLVPVVKESREGSQKIQKLSNQLQQRKRKLQQKTNRSSQIIHLIKEPYQHSNTNIEADLEYVVRTAEKVIRRVKRVEVSNESVMGIMRDLRDFVELRKAVRLGESDFRNAERELELRVGCRMVVQQLGQSLVQFGKKELQMKSLIESKINQLPMK